MESPVPAYVDTKTPLRQWYLINIVFLVASLAMAFGAALIVEYEFAKLTHPLVSFIPTPIWFDLSFSSLIILLGIANLSVLFFVFFRHLWLHPWMIGTTLFGWVLLAIQALVLHDRLLPILLPGYR